MRQASQVVISSFLALLLMFPYMVLASPKANAGSDSITTASTQVEQLKQDAATEKRKQIMNEAVAAINETHNALKALDENKKVDAVAALERAIGKLELILTRAPHLALAPVDVSAITINIAADATTVNQVRKKAEKLLADGQVQAARHLLGGLASETVINVSSIPLATYPAAIRQAVKLVDVNKQEQAKAVLQTALSTLVITSTVIPLPIVTAEKLITDAEKLAIKNNRTTAENDQVATLLTKTRQELEFAQALGYGTKKGFDKLYEQLKSIEDKTSGGKSGTGFFTLIKQYLENMVKANQPQSAQQ